MTIRPIILSLLIMLSAGLVQAQTATKVSDFSLVNARDNNSLSLSDYKNKKAVVVIFTSNYCPYSKLYDRRIQKLVNDYSGKNIQFLLINPNTSSGALEESEVEMKKKVSALGINVPYLVDKDHNVTQLFGATKTPEAYLLTPVAGNYNIVYAGAIDDNPQVEGDVSKSYLREAIDAALGNKLPNVKSTRATGCMIKKPLAGM